MDNAAQVGVIQCRKKLQDIVHRFLLGDTAPLRPMLNGEALNQLHNHHQLAVNLKSGAELSDVRMGEAGEDTNLSRKARGSLWFGGKLLLDDFHRLNTIAQGIADPEDLPHSAGAQGA